MENSLLFRASEEARGDAELAQKRLQFLAQAGEALSSSLDLSQNIEAVARLAVPAMADWCVIDRVDASGEILQNAVAHADPKKVELAREVQRRFPPDYKTPRENNVFFLRKAL